MYFRSTWLYTRDSYHHGVFYIFGDYVLVFAVLAWLELRCWLTLGTDEAAQRVIYRKLAEEQKEQGWEQAWSARRNHR